MSGDSLRCCIFCLTCVRSLYESEQNVSQLCTPSENRSADSNAALVASRMKIIRQRDIPYKRRLSKWKKAFNFRRYDAHRATVELARHSRKNVRTNDITGRKNKDRTRRKPHADPRRANLSWIPFSRGVRAGVR